MYWVCFCIFGKMCFSPLAKIKRNAAHYDYKIGLKINHLINSFNMIKIIRICLFCLRSLIPVNALLLGPLYYNSCSIFRTLNPWRPLLMSALGVSPASVYPHCDLRDEMKKVKDIWLEQTQDVEKSTRHQAVNLSNTHLIHRLVFACGQHANIQPSISPTLHWLHNLEDLSAWLLKGTMSDKN